MRHDAVLLCGATAAMTGADNNARLILLAAAPRYSLPAAITRECRIFTPYFIRLYIIPLSIFKEPRCAAPERRLQKSNAIQAMKAPVTAMKPYNHDC